jgi:hypothetical protein
VTTPNDCRFCSVAGLEVVAALAEELVLVPVPVQGLEVGVGVMGETVVAVVVTDVSVPVGVLPGSVGVPVLDAITRW